MPNEIRDTLKSLGFNDREIAVYLAILPIGSAPASVLAKRTNISRSTVQFTCQQLRKKGILHMVRKGPTNLFSVEPPEKLLFLLRSERERLEQKEDQVQRILGRLKAMVDPQVVLPRVEFFEGASGIASAYNKVLMDVQKSGGEILSLAQPLLSLRNPPIDVEEAVNAFDAVVEFPLKAGEAGGCLRGKDAGEFVTTIIVEGKWFLNRAKGWAVGVTMVDHVGRLAVQVAARCPMFLALGTVVGTPNSTPVYAPK